MVLRGKVGYDERVASNRLSVVKRCGEWDVSVPFSHIVAIFDVQPTLGGKHDAENNVTQAIKTQWKSPVGPRYSWVFSHSCEMWIKL